MGDPSSTLPWPPRMPVVLGDRAGFPKLEARAYLEHPVLGERLVECAHTLTDLDADDPEAVLGPVDARKLHSSMTLFLLASPGQTEFAAVLRQYFAGRQDEATLALL